MEEIAMTDETPPAGQPAHTRMSATSAAGVPADADAPAPAPRRRRVTRRGLLSLLGLVFAGFVFLVWSGLGEHIWGGDPPPRKPAIVHDAPEDAPAETPGQRLERWRGDVVGRWHTYFKGDRYMTVRPDGTATIEANLVDYAWHEKLLVGAAKVTFEIEWSLDDDSLTFVTVGGHPSGSVDVITGIHGATKTYPVVHVTEDEFRYRTEGDDPDYVWKRIAEES